jgi:hypothetical protein
MIHGKNVQRGFPKRFPVGLWPDVDIAPWKEIYAAFLLQIDDPSLILGIKLPADAMMALTSLSWRWARSDHILTI